MARETVYVILRLHDSDKQKAVDWFISNEPTTNIFNCNFAYVPDVIVEGTLETVRNFISGYSKGTHKEREVNNIVGEAYAFYYVYEGVPSVRLAIEASVMNTSAPKEKVKNRVILRHIYGHDAEVIPFEEKKAIFEWVNGRYRFANFARHNVKFSGCNSEGVLVYTILGGLNAEDPVFTGTADEVYAYLEKFSE